MACFTPVDAWRSQVVNPSGKRGITFSLREGFQDMALQVPCGKCDGCRADKARVWSLRMYHESSLHKQNSFVTLTYADAPERLIKEDLQKFFKRLRHKFDFRYFACGEYGETTNRPHYHAVIFGQDFRDSGDGVVNINDQLYTNSVLQEAWGHGQVAVADVTMATCCYVAGYVHKKIGDEDTFTVMSRRPGIGSEWLAKYKDDLIRTGSVTVEGKEYPVPLRYLQWYESDFQYLKAERAARFKKMSPDEKWSKAEQRPAAKLAKAAQLKLRSKQI